MPMKKYTYLIALLVISTLTFSFKSASHNTDKMISFNVRGNGKTNVSLGVGYQVGSGACCRGVSKESTVGFQGNVGDVLYDSNTKRVITKVYAEMEGKTIDLRQYY
jgi:hypothetical protein